MNTSSPEYDLAILIRQYVRASQADDQVAAAAMYHLLGRDLEGAFVSLLSPAKEKGGIDLWFDGIGAEQVKVLPPFGLEILGYIWCGRGSDGSQWQEPLAAELRASAHHSSLRGFNARFGDRERLISERVILCDPSDYEVAGFRVRIGSAVPGWERQPVPWQWGCEFLKGNVAN
jgi:hypothetical protein